LPAPVQTRVTTLDGLRATAATLALFAEDIAQPDPHDDISGQMVAAILHDLMGGVVRVRPSRSPTSLPA
jgi:hypothetical protein